MISAFLDILEKVSFDEDIFRKEFLKTLGWASENDRNAIQNWMKDHHIPEKFPDLARVFSSFVFETRSAE